MSIGFKIFLIPFILLLPLIDTGGQTPSGKLIIKAKSDKEYVKLWDTIYLKNKDTSFRFAFDNSKKKNTYSIPSGEYTVTLKSLLRGTISKEIKVKKRVRVKFNTTAYYKPYRDTNSILYQMKDGDTCFVNYNKGTNNIPTQEYFMVVKEGAKYIIVIKNEINEWRSIQVFDYEFQEFVQYGKYKGLVLTGDNEDLGVYYWSLNRLILSRSCGICLYGFLLRKRLVKMP